MKIEEVDFNEKSDLINFEVYLYALSSVKDSHQFDLLINFMKSTFNLSEQEAFTLQQSYLNVINIYRTVKDKSKYKNQDNSINFNDLAKDISRSTTISSFISNGNLFVKGKLIKKDSDGNVYLKRNIVELPKLKTTVIKHIIERISVWETQEI